MKRTVERRTQRSGDTLEALTYQLEYTRCRAGASALVLSLDDGLVIASAGDAMTCMELAAVAPLLNRSLVNSRFKLELEDVKVCCLNVLGQQLYLATIGGGVACDAVVQSSLDGIRRIISHGDLRRTPKHLLN
jgi:hypothetical protein